MTPPHEGLMHPDDNESEKASNSYLMSLIAVMAGLPFPIVNLLATAFFSIANRKGTYFVRWHCTQALLSQAVALLMNVPGIWWTIAVVLGKVEVSNAYIAYIVTIVFFNLLEFGATVYAATRTRRGKHVEWWLFGPLAQILVKP